MNFLLMYLIEIMPDGGPIYAETNAELFIVEPFNAISSLAYLIPAFYWFINLRGQYKNYPFLLSCLPFLVAGGVGSTLYHAFRSSSFLLLLDVIPVAIVCLMVSIYFWFKVVKKWLFVIMAIAPFVVIRFFLFHLLSDEVLGFHVHHQTIINISYLISGVMIFLPALLLLSKNHFNDFLPLLTSCVFFILGLLCREADTWGIFLPVGTHWLWHVSTAAGGYFLGLYLFKLRNREMSKGK